MTYKPAKKALTSSGKVSRRQTCKTKTIQIFIPDCNPRGIKVVDIKSRAVQVCFALLSWVG